MFLLSTASSSWPLFATILVFATAALAITQAETSDFHVITRPFRDEIVRAGSIYQIVWTPNLIKYPGPVNIVLVSGQSMADLVTLLIPAVSVDGAVAKYDWKVDDWLGDRKIQIFAIMLIWEQDSSASVLRYSNGFQILAPEAPGPADVTSPVRSSIFVSSTTGSTAPTASSSQTISDVAASSSQTILDGAASSTQTISDGDNAERQGKSSNSVPIVVPVVLGVVLGLVVLAALGWFVWRKKKQSKKTQGGMVPAALETSGEDKGDPYGVVGELPAHERPVEVSGEGARRAELE